MATKKKILIVIDVQNDFITGCLRNEDAIKHLPNIVNLVKNEKFDETYVTMDTHNENYFDTLEGKKLPVKHCIKGTNGWEMPTEFKDALYTNQNVVQVFEKSTFGSTWMSKFLLASVDSDYEHKEDYEFTFVGYCSDICVVSNALMLRAHLPNNKIVVRKDCTAGVTPETNEAALKTMEMCQIEVI